MSFENIKSHFNKKNKSEELIFPIVKINSLDEDKNNLKEKEEGKVFLKTSEDEERIFQEYYTYLKIQDLDYFIKINSFKYKKDIKDVISVAMFKTQYGFAKTNLTKNSLDKLFENVNYFFNTVYKDNNSIKSMFLTVSEFPYSVSDINLCINEILYKSNIYKKEDFFDEGEIDTNKLFKIYKELYFKDFKPKEDFEIREENLIAPEKRKRLFEVYLEKYLKGWRIEDSSKNNEISLLVTKI